MGEEITRYSAEDEVVKDTGLNRDEVNKLPEREKVLQDILGSQNSVEVTGDYYDKVIANSSIGKMLTTLGVVVTDGFIGKKILTRNGAS